MAKVFLFKKQFKIYIMLNIQATGKHYNETITIKQISKIAAKKLFDAGIEIFLQSSNYYPFGVWQSICPIKIETDKLSYHFSHNQFDVVTNEYRYYNCDSERGKYIHFYQKIFTANN